jgi:hypothetical protein
MLAGKVGGRPRGRRQPQTCLQWFLLLW